VFSPLPRNWTDPNFPTRDDVIPDTPRTPLAGPLSFICRSNTGPPSNKRKIMSVYPAPFATRCLLFVCPFFCLTRGPLCLDVSNRRYLSFGVTAALLLSAFYGSAPRFFPPRQAVAGIQTSVSRVFPPPEKFNPQADRVLPRGGSVTLIPPPPALFLQFLHPVWERRFVRSVRFFSNIFPSLFLVFSHPPLFLSVLSPRASLLLSPPRAEGACFPFPGVFN